MTTGHDPTRINITLFGDGGCGKSSITLRLVRSQWTSEYDPTIVDSYTLTRRVDGQTYHLSLTDTAGQEEYRGLWGGSNLKSADAFLLVYDITSRRSLQGLSFFWDVIMMEEESQYDAWLANNASTQSRPLGLAQRGHTRERMGFVKPVKIVAGNKCDLADVREVSASEGLDWARKRECGFMETSARNTVNIEETFELIVRRVAEARRAARMSDSNEAEGEGSGKWGGAEQVDEVLEEGTTRMATTRPLSPLPSGGETGEKDVKLDRGRGRWRRWWGNLFRCGKE